GSLSACGKKAEYIRDITASDYVTLGNYKGIEVTISNPEAEAQQSVEEYLAYLDSVNTELVEVTDRTVVEEGDTVNIDYTGYRDGVAFDGGTATGQDLTIGSGSFIPGFEDGLIGKEVGETVMLDLTFPADYRSEEMAGAEVTFEVVINSISILEQKELTVEFVNELTQLDCGTVEEFKETIYNLFYEDAVSANESVLTSTITQEVMANCIFVEPPEKMVERYRDMQIEDMTAQLAAYGTDLNTYMQTYYGMNAEEYMQAFKETAIQIAQEYIMLQAIADVEGFTLTEEEIAQAMEEQAAAYGCASAEELKKEMGEEIFYENLMAEKVLDFLKENAEIHVEQ
ncbi:MAG: trigger factor, partial [Lachnospiraceae bacterium]|nr:trigger factor [Lachnospiraceae bacterium]